jgi:hypothetical protein
LLSVRITAITGDITMGATTGITTEILASEELLKRAGG